MATIVLTSCFVAYEEKKISIIKSKIIHRAQMPMVEQGINNLSTSVLPTKAKRLRKAIGKKGLYYFNLIVVFVVSAIVVMGRSEQANPISLLSQSSNKQEFAALDSLSSADIAASIAFVVSLPEAVTISNQADTYNAQLSLANIDQSAVSKPQLVTGGTKSRKDIQKYTTIAGDSVSKLATKFGVTSDSIRWSNGLYGDYLLVGKELLIPPVNGVVYKVKSGDTIASIAQRYQANQAEIIAFNDVELSGLPVGEYILIPNGEPVSTGNGSAVYGYVPSYGGNGYTYGYCTYYVASRVSVPRNWGNANTWAYYARLSGWIVSSKPIPGAIAQNPNMSYWGHVAYVEDVSEDGTMILYSDMNALAGWNRVGYSGWVPASTYPNYIYR